MMRYYSEKAAEPLRLRFEKKVLLWPKVSTRKMFGCPCYQADGRLFAFLVTNGIVITQLTRTDRETVCREFRAAPFRSGTRVVQKWMRVPIQRTSDLDRVMRVVRHSYDAALLGAQDGDARDLVGGHVQVATTDDHARLMIRDPR